MRRGFSNDSVLRSFCAASPSTEGGGCQLQGAKAEPPAREEKITHTLETMELH